MERISVRRTCWIKAAKRARPTSEPRVRKRWKEEIAAAWSSSSEFATVSVTKSVTHETMEIRKKVGIKSLLNATRVLVLPMLTKKQQTMKPRQTPKKDDVTPPVKIVIGIMPKAKHAYEITVSQ